MPHIILETTADLPENANVPDILEALVETLSARETVSPEAVKAYHTLRSNWAMGAGAPPGFAHVTVKVVTGRSQEWLNETADAIYRVMKEQFDMSLEAEEVALTLEICEMNKESYRKS